MWKRSNRQAKELAMKIGGGSSIFGRSSLSYGLLHINQDLNRLCNREEAGLAVASLVTELSF